MNNFLDTVFASSPLKFNILDSNGNTLYSNAQINLATAIQTQGTALNKVFFDSIKTDLTNLTNNKLNVSAKATTAQAQAGTDDTNYVTSLKVRQFMQYLTKAKTLTSSTSTTAQNFTLFDASAISSDIGSTNAGLVKKIIITGSATGGSSSNPTRIEVGGIGFQTFEMADGSTSRSQNAPSNFLNIQSHAIPFKYEIDLVANSIFYEFFQWGGSSTTPAYYKGMSLFSTFTGLTGKYNGRGGSTVATINATITYVIG